jgi:hypothetical protein
LLVSGPDGHNGLGNERDNFGPWSAPRKPDAAIRGDFGKEGVNKVIPTWRQDFGLFHDLGDQGQDGFIARFVPHDLSPNLHVRFHSGGTQYRPGRGAADLQRPMHRLLHDVVNLALYGANLAKGYKLSVIQRNVKDWIHGEEAPQRGRRYAGANENAARTLHA